MHENARLTPKGRALMIAVISRMVGEPCIDITSGTAGDFQPLRNVTRD
jgi:hypothetical protein